MQPYARNEAGLLTQTDRETGESSYQTFTSYMQSLDNVVSVSGNGKDPNVQAFDTRRTQNWRGSYDILRDNGSGTLSRGQFGVPYGPPTPVNGGFDTAVYNTALERAYEKLRGSVDVSVDSFQWRQTKDMAAKLSKLSYSWVAEVAKLRRTIRDPRRLVTAVADSYLGYTFGIKPTFQTIYDGVQKLRQPTSPWVNLQGSASSREQGTFETDGIFVPEIPCRYTYRASKRCRFVLNFAPANDRLEALAGFTSLNPANIAWELIPGSFLVDYIFDVGGYLRNCENAMLYSSSFLGGYVTQGTLITTEGRHTGSHRYDDYGLDALVNVFGSDRTASKLRQPLSSIPLPNLPKFSLDLSSGQLTNVAALLAGVLRRHPYLGDVGQIPGWANRLRR